MQVQWVTPLLTLSCWVPAVPSAGRWQLLLTQPNPVRAPVSLFLRAFFNFSTSFCPLDASSQYLTSVKWKIPKTGVLLPGR